MGVSQASPAIVTRAGAQQLPRWVLLCLCAAYIVPGFFGREPWKNADVATYGIVNWMASGAIDWWHPVIPGQTGSSPGLLPHWLGALLVQALPQQAEWVYRLPAMLCVAATFYLTWHAVFRFALLRSAQPVSFAFGGQAMPVDYARAIADSGLLALMGTLGLAQLSHEATPDVFLMTGLASVLYASARMAHGHTGVDTHALLAWLVGLVVMGLSGMPLLTASVACVVPAWYALHQPAPHPAHAQTLPKANTSTVAAAVGAMATAAVWWWTAPWEGFVGYEEAWPASWLSFLQMLTWFTWPLWPLAAWTLWRWRQHWRQSHLALPTLLTVVVGIASAWANGSDRIVLLALPALAVLAAFALPTLQRSVSALIDWFSVLFFSLCATVVWVVWVAMLTGTPAKPAANVARLAPGFEASFDAVTFAVALVASLCWVAVVAWRISRHPPAIWKSVVLPATGGTLCWLLLMTLWLPLLDHARSYGPLARRLASHLEGANCVATLGLNTAQLSGLAHQGGIPIDMRPAADSDCAHLIASPHHRYVPEHGDARWQLVARFNRLTDRKESLLLFRQAPTPARPLEPVVIEDTD